MGVRLVKYGVINGTGTYNHDELKNRDLPDQHPVSAITGLTDIIDEIVELIKTSAVIEKTIETPSLSLTYSKEDKSLTGNVKILESEDNALVERRTGLFVDKYLDVDLQDTETIHLTMEGKGETLETMYKTGTKFSHNWTWVNDSVPSESSAWYYDANLESFVQPQNTGSYTGFISTVNYRTYTHRATLKSTDGDNDGIGVIIAYAKDEEGNPHTLSLVINKGGESHVGSYYYALIYDKSLPDQQILFTKGNKPGGTIPGNHSTSGWNGTSITVEVNKSGSIITCAASNYNSSEINENTIIEIDVNDYAWGHLFRGKVQYGYCAQSQAYSFFQNIYFDGKGPLKGDVILSKESYNLLKVLEDGLCVLAEDAIEKDSTNLLRIQNGKLYLSDSILSEGGGGGGSVFITKTFADDIVIGDLICYNPTTKQFEKAIYSPTYVGKVLGLAKSIIEDVYLYVQTDGVFFTNYFEENDIPILTKLYLSTDTLGAFSQTEGKTYIGEVVDGGLCLDITFTKPFVNLTKDEIDILLSHCFD